MKKLSLSLLGTLVLAFSFSGKASAQNGAFAPYLGAGVSTTANLGFTNPNYVVKAGIESSSKYLLLDVNGAFNSANPIRVVKTSGALATGSGYTLGVNGSGYYKFFGHVLAGGGANWSVNPATVVSTVQNKAVRLNAFRSGANPFLGGGLQTKHDRFLANYNLPGNDALPNQRAVDFHNELLLGKGHVRLTQDVSINSYFNAANASGVQVPGTNIRVTGTSVGAGIKLVL